MAIRLALACVLAVVVCAAAGVEPEVEENVYVLTTDNFKPFLEENQFVLVEFYAPWCGHCKRLAPEYAKAATTLAGEDSAVKLAKVDATEESDLAKDYEVRGYPTIKFFKSGNMVEYSGGRTAPEIVTWLLKHTGPPAEDLTTVEAAKAFVEKDDAIVIGFFKSSDSEAAKAYVSAAESHESLQFGITTSKEVADALEATTDSIVVFKKFDDGRATYDGEFTPEGILAFVNVEQMPLVVEFTDETAQKIFTGDVKSHLLAFYAKEGEEAEQCRATLQELAPDNKGKLLFVYVDSSTEANDRIVDFFNLDKDSLPAFRIINLEEDMKRYVPKFSANCEVEKLREFVNNFNEGKLSPHLNSEEIPEDWNSEPVKVLVGKNFDDVVYDKSKDVFVEFYAPWCGHCKQLAPIWEELAEHFQEDKDVVIAKMDSTKNEVENISVQGFPTLKFFRKETNEMVDYNGGRTLEDLTKFVEEQVSGAGEEEEEEEEEGEGEEEKGEEEEEKPTKKTEL